MENIIRKVIISVVSEYWKPYNELEKNIKISLAKKNILADSIFCAGELVNMYIYVHVNSTLYIYNKNSDIRNAFLIKRFGIKKVAFNNGLAVIKGFYHDLNQLPQVTIINMCVIENFPIPRLNLSTGSIAAYIRFYQKARVNIIDMQLRVTIEDIIKTLESNPPAIIGISISFGQKNLSDVLIQQISSNTKLMKSMLVVGNVIPSLYCKEYLSHNPNLIVSYKEGEESFLDLIDCYLNKIELENVRGIAYISKNGDLKKNNIDLLDLKNLPFPALDTLEGIFYYKGALTLELSRGCNYSKCTFCPRQHKGIQWRCLSVDRMVLYFSILADICKKLHQAPFFYIADEEFIGQLPHDTELKRIYEFCNRIKKIGLDVRFDISARVDSIYREDFTERQNIERLQMWSMLKEIGLQRLFLGVESGCDNQLRRFNKGTTANQNATAIRLITALGINIRIGYITFDPLMENFEDIITGHEFIERTDILYKSVDLNIVSFNEIFDVIVNNNSSPYICLQNKPLYYKVSYPLTSLEVLFSTKYALHIKAYQEVHNITLLEDIDMNMARYRSMYVNKLIGEVSTACQRWIDYNFPVLYSLKGLYKSSTGQVRERIYQLMCYAKSIDHYLLNYILYQLSITDCDINLEKFVSKHDFHLTKFEEIKFDVLKKSLDFWQNIELYFINEVENLLNKNVITDTDDFALTNAIKNWRNNRGNWSMIN